MDNGISVHFDIWQNKLYIWTYNHIKECKFIYGVYDSYTDCVDKIKIEKNCYRVTWYHLFSYNHDLYDSYFSADSISEVLFKFAEEDCKKIVKIELMSNN